jgi:hypothetical protein
MQRRREVAKGRMRWIALAVLILAANVQAAPPAAAQRAEIANSVGHYVGSKIKGIVGSKVKREFRPLASAFPPFEAPADFRRVDLGKNIIVYPNGVRTREEVAKDAADWAGRQCAGSPSAEYAGRNRCEDIFDR